MADSKLSLEDILDEYKANPDDKSTSGVNREDTRRILNSTIPDPVREVMEVLYFQDLR